MVVISIEYWDTEQMEREAWLSALRRKTVCRPGERGSGEDAGGRGGGGIRKFLGGQVSLSGTTDLAVHLNISPLISLASITSFLLQVITSIRSSSAMTSLLRFPSLSTLIPNAGHLLPPSHHLLRSAKQSSRSHPFQNQCSVFHSSILHQCDASWPPPSTL